MLMNLLPGLRDLRTPLATGYIWLISLWLVLHGRIPARQHAHGAALAVYQLHDEIGRPASLAAVSFLAFVVGQAQVNPDLIVRSLRRIAPRVQALRWPALISPDVIYRLQSYLGQDASDERRSQTDGAAFTFAADLRLVALQAQVQKPDMWQGYDRLAAEAAFRINVGLALAGLSTVLIVTTHTFWWLIPAGTALGMVVGGLYRQRMANDYLIQLVVSRAITVEEIDAVIEQSRQLAARSTEQSEPMDGLRQPTTT
jgi:hypothetical protein